MTFVDPQGDFSLTYPSNWRNITTKAAAEWADQSSDFEMVFAAANRVGGIAVKRGSLPPYWTRISSDRDFLYEYVVHYEYEDPTVTNAGSHTEVNRNGVVGIEVEITHTEAISLRRFFRIRGDTLLEVFCASSPTRWDSERKECRELLEGFEIRP